jgi:phosphoribosyl 1,2-cyclic phosphodiesterase
MSLFIASLNSGSNGNCYYVGNDSEAILVDAGISCREIEKRMRQLDLPLQKLKAVFISHEHADHIRGITVLSKKYSLPVYITTTTQKFGGLRLEKNLSVPFRPHEPVAIGGLSILPFPKMHDAADPCSFLITHKGVHVGVFTDIGTPCAQVIRHFGQCHAAFLEANYDEDMLENGGYPYHLKKRIRGGMGHLSNSQALQLFQHHRPDHMTHLVLTHLSSNNNSPALVQELFARHAQGVEMVVASRYEASPVLHIRNEGEKLSVPGREQVKPAQLELF